MTRKIMFVCFSILVAGVTMNAEVTLKCEKSPYGEKVILKNRFIQTCFYPEWGGRMGEMIDLKSGVNTVFWDYPPDHPKWGHGWGGALDDRGGWHTAYKLEILKETPGECVIKMTRRLKKKMIKKIISLKKNTPSIGVAYHFFNLSQKQTAGYEVAIRNFFRPSGKASSDWEIEKAVIPTTKTIRVVGDKAVGAPELNSKFYTEIMPTWNAFVNQKTELGIAVAFDNTLYRWFYRWISGGTSTYEWVFAPIPAGKEAVTNFTISLVHGMSRYVDVTSDYALNVDFEQKRPQLQFYAVSGDLKNIVIKSELRDVSTGKIEKLSDTTLGIVKAGEIITTIPKWRSFERKNMILSQTVLCDNKKIGDYTIPVEIANPPKSYFREKIGKGAPVFKDIPDWKKDEIKDVVKPTREDRERGYVVYQDDFAATLDVQGRLLKKIELDLGRNEYESVAFEIRALNDLEKISLSTDSPYLNLRLEKISPIPAAIKVGKPDMKSHTLIDNKTFNLKKGATRSIWLTWNGNGVKPGIHHATVTISPQNAPRYVLKLKIHIYDVEISERNIFDFQLGGGYIFAFLAKLSGGDMKKTMPYIKDLGSHRCGVANLFCGVEQKGLPFLPTAELKDRKTGKTIKLGDIKDDTVLDLSWYDKWIGALIDNGLLRIHSRQSGTSERTAYQKGAMRELARYLSEKGYPYRDRYVKFIDEQPPECYPAMAKTGEMYHTLGWRVMHTSFPVDSAVQMKMLNSSTDIWHGVIPSAEALDARKKEGALDENDEIWTYDGWGALWMPYISRRNMAWNCVAHDLDGMHLHVYHRGKPMENIVEVSPDGPISSPAWEGARDGLEDVQYYRQARNILDNLTRNKVDVPGLAKKRAALDKVKSTMFPASYLNLRIADLQSARKKCLDLLLELKPYQSKLKQSAHYGFTRLMKDNKSSFKLFGEKPAVKLFMDDIKEKTGQTIAHTKAIPDAVNKLKENAILLVDKRSAICLELMNKDLIPMTKEYPRNGSYAIWKIPNPEAKGKWIILIVGGDSKGLTQGTRNFLRFLRVTPGLY